MTPLRALLVDFDGTLADTAAANYRAYATALAEVEVTVDRETFDRVAFGRNWRQFLPALLATASSPADPAEVAQRKVELYPLFFGEVQINTALLRLIELNRPACRIALVTTASARNVRGMLRHFGIEDRFDLIITGEDVVNHKPDPEAYVLAARQLDVQPDECLVFEDSEIGLASARRFGAASIQVVFTPDGIASER